MECFELYIFLTFEFTRESLDTLFIDIDIDNTDNIDNIDTIAHSLKVDMYKVSQKKLGETLNKSSRASEMSERQMYLHVE